MIRFFRTLLETLQGLVGTLDDAATTLARIEQTLREDGDLRTRVEAIERGMAQHMADAEALVTKADSTFKAARRAEERERHHAERAEAAKQEAEDSLALDPEELEALPPGYAELLERNAEGVPPEGVQPVRDPLEGLSGKERAKALKWGRGG